MDEPWKPYAKWKKTDTTAHIFNDSISMESYRTNKSIATESELVVKRSWEKVGNGELKGIGFLCEIMKTLWNEVVVIVV